MCNARRPLFNVIDSASEKNKRQSPLLSRNGRNGPRRTPTKSALAITKITTGGVARHSSSRAQDEADLFVV